MPSKLRKTCSWLHLWLGLLSGIVVFIVCITGGLCVFRDEIEAATEPWRFVTPEPGRTFLPPSTIVRNASEALRDTVAPSAVTYGQDGDAVWVDYFGEKGMSTVFLNPYTGSAHRLVSSTGGQSDFFSVMMAGHRRLWLPRGVGNYIVSYGVLVFVVVLLTGLVMWWPRRWSAKAAKARLTMHRPMRGARLTLDLHNVLGFYFLVPLIVIGLTGLVFGLSWFSRTVYFAASGGQTMQDYTLPPSDTLSSSRTPASLDVLYNKVRKANPDACQFYFALPQSKDGCYRVSIVHERGSYYKTDNLFFDQYSLRPLKGTGPYAGRYADASGADKFFRMMLDIHDGNILGIVGKIIAFGACIVGASLPVTGLMLYLRRRRQRRAVPRKDCRQGSSPQGD